MAAFVAKNFRTMRNRLSNLLLLLTLMAVAALAAGCSRNGGNGEFGDLFISKHRWVEDEERELVHVYGELQNTGDSRFREVEIHATLRSPARSNRGENSVILQNIRPREKRLFSLSINSRDSVSSVELQVRKPEAP